MEQDGPGARGKSGEIAALKAEIARLEADLAQARAQIAQLTAFADQDPLLPEVLNRRAFLRETSRIISFADRYDIEAALIYFDLNSFKQINDTFGHAAGDKVLRTVGGLLRSNVRDSDLVGRLGGDEFAVVLAKAEPAAAVAKARELAGLIGEEEIPLGDGAVAAVACSFGICPFKGKMDPEAAIAAADQAMYAARSGGAPAR